MAQVDADYSRTPKSNGDAQMVSTLGLVKRHSSKSSTVNRRSEIVPKYAGVSARHVRKRQMLPENVGHHLCRSPALYRLGCTNDVIRAP